MSQVAQPISHVQWIPRERLHANDYNPNHVAPPELRLLRQSILETGWTQPIVALTDLTIVDGFHRWTVSADPAIAAMTGGLVPVVIVDIDERHRVAATIRHNRARGVHGVFPMAKIVASLKAAGWDDARIRLELGMDDEEIARLLEQRGSPEKFAKGAEYSKGWVPDQTKV